MLLNKASIRKGNILVLTVILLAAISTVAAGITGYFVTTSKIDNKINEPSRIKRELNRQFNDTYSKLLKNEEKYEGLTIHEHLQALEQGNSYLLVNNGYNNKFTYISLVNDEKVYSYSVTYSGYELDASLTYQTTLHTYAYKEVYLR